MARRVDSQCSTFQTAIDILSSRWNALILNVLQEGPLRFSELSERAQGPGDKVLSARLKALEEDKRRTDRLAAMGALATGIAHEIRNPLVAIKTFAELLPERADDQEFKSTFAKVAAKEVHRIEELLGRLRALAVPTVSTLHPLDLGGPITDTLDLLRGEADRRHVRIVSEVEPDLPQILGETDQLKQLFLNLFLNALDAMATGGTLSVTARADRPRRTSRGRADADATGVLTVRVTDTGPGIPREDLHRIFEPFFTTKPKGEGTGLGLGISRRIVDKHGGEIRCTSQPGRTVFGVRLPVAPAPTDDAPAPAGDAPAPSGGAP